ncbi:MAG: hypothetical protein IPJ68_00730 [Candidatus Moraniibacteriota bacterium]|nr:MAG: hypothetical protein IPJ68_00730 [Candidatus Moranbacteria bacterium]
MILDTRKAFNAGRFQSQEEFLAFLLGDTLYEHRNIYFQCDSQIYYSIEESLRDKERKRCFRVEVSRLEGYTGYFFLTNISRTALEKNDSEWPKAKINRSLKNEALMFDTEKSLIAGKTAVSKIKPNTKENGLCVFLFKQKTDHFVDWSLFMEHCTGSEYNMTKDDKAKNNSDKKMIKDTIDRINKRVQKDFDVTDELFQFERNCIKRNF